jgi:hypothetical protein
MLRSCIWCEMGLATMHAVAYVQHSQVQYSVSGAANQPRQQLACHGHGFVLAVTIFNQPKVRGVLALLCLGGVLTNAWSCCCSDVFHSSPAVTPPTGDCSL